MKGQKEREGGEDSGEGQKRIGINQEEKMQRNVAKGQQVMRRTRRKRRRRRRAGRWVVGNWWTKRAQSPAENVGTRDARYPIFCRCIYNNSYGR